MIHSLSGGVIAENGMYTFVKAQAESIWWYVCPFSEVKEGDKVLLSRGSKTFEGTVLKVERAVSNQCAPVPMNRAGKVEKILEQ